MRYIIMEEIKYMEKPEWVSWEDVRNCITAAHQTNKKLGFEMLNSKLTAEELMDRLKECHCFVALVDKNVVGTLSVKLQRLKKWWVKDIVAYYCYDAILPKYRGTDIFFELSLKRWAFVNKTGVKIHQFNTAEHNKTVIKINEKEGYKLVQFSPTMKGADYYSVTMVKWDDGCPFPDWFLKFMFNLSKIVSKTLWKPGYKRRFWFN